MREFVVEEMSFRLSEVGQNSILYAERIETTLDLMELILERNGDEILFSEDLFNQEIVNGLTFYDLYHPDSVVYIPREVQERISAIFGRLRTWQEASGWPAELDAAVNGALVEYAPTIAFAHMRAGVGDHAAVPCIELSGSSLAGRLSVVAAGEETYVWFMSNELKLREFYRWEWVHCATTNDHRESIARVAFPELMFVPGVFQGIKEMDGAEEELRLQVCHHLACLSDHGRRIFHNAHQRVPSEFGALGVDISDENGNTKSSNLARRERMISVDGVERVFWWHTKLQPHKNRIHIDPNPIATGGKLIVGIMCKHLRTR